MIDSTDNTVTVCMDYIKSRCSREKCKYFHPPAHLQAKIKSGQQQVSQTAMAAQATAAAMVRPSLILKVFTAATVTLLGLGYLQTTLFLSSRVVKILLQFSYRASGLSWTNILLPALKQVLQLYIPIHSSNEYWAVPFCNQLHLITSL